MMNFFKKVWEGIKGAAAGAANWYLRMLAKYPVATTLATVTVSMVAGLPVIFDLALLFAISMGATFGGFLVLWMILSFIYMCLVQFLVNNLLHEAVRLRMLGQLD